MRVYKKIGKVLLLAIALALVLLQCGCASVSVVYRESGFALSKFKEATTGIGGVTPRESVQYMEQDIISTNLFNALRQKYPNHPILFPNEVAQIIGKKMWTNIVVEFEEQAILSSETLRRLKPFADKVRFLIMLDLRKNETRSYYAAGWVEDWQPGVIAYRDYYYRAASGGYRSIKCVCVVYDLQIGRSVWAAVGKTSRSTHKSSRDYYRPTTVSQIDPPPTSELLKPLIRRFVSSL